MKATPYMLSVHTVWRDLDHAIVSGSLQGRISQYTAEQEKELGDLQGLVGPALAVPKEAVQPVFESLGKRHLSMFTQQQKLQLQPALFAAVIQCLGGCLTEDKGLMVCIQTPQHCCLRCLSPAVALVRFLYLL